MLLMFFGVYDASGVARWQGGSRPSPSTLMKKLVFENAQICNKSDTIEGSFETAIATALSIWNMAYLYEQKGVSLMFKGCDQKLFHCALPPGLCCSVFLQIGCCFNSGHGSGV